MTSSRWSVRPRVATGFTGIGFRWSVLVIGQLRKWPNLLGCCSRRRKERPWVPLVVLPDETQTDPLADFEGVSVALAQQTGETVARWPCAIAVLYPTSSPTRIFVSSSRS